MATSAPTSNEPTRLFIPAGLLLLTADAGESWEEVCRSGRYASARVEKGKPVRVVNLPPSAIDEMVETYALTEAQGWYPGGPPVDVNHASEYAVDAESTKAFGRIRALEARPNDKGGRSLWARIVWNDEGVVLASNRAFGGFSAEVYTPGEVCDRLTLEPILRWVFRGATMTNRPAILGMQPLQGPGAVGSDPASIAASERRGNVLLLADDPQPDQEGPKKMGDTVDLGAALKAALDSPSPEAFSALKTLISGMDDAVGAAYMAGMAAGKAGVPAVEEPAPMADAPMDPAKPEEEQPAAQVMALADGAKATLLAEQNVTLKRTADRLTAELAEKDRQLKAEQEKGWARLLDDAIRDGRIGPAERGEYRDTVHKMGQEFADKHFGKGRTGVGQVQGYSGADAANRAGSGESDSTAQVLRLADERSKSLTAIADPVARHREALFQVRRENPHLFAAKEG